MPVFAIKARDNLAVDTVIFYRDLCIRHGLREQAAEVHKAILEMVNWRAAHSDECKMPDHKHASAGEPGSGSGSR
jgi:heterodisulfide reductase subunit C